MISIVVIYKRGVEVRRHKLKRIWKTKNEAMRVRFD
jgi:hypothetical protein